MWEETAWETVPDSHASQQVYILTYSTYELHA